MRLPKGSPADKDIRKLLDDLWATLDVQPYADRSGRQKIMADLLTRLTTKKESMNDMLQFYGALQQLGDLKLQKSMADNRFLETLSRGSDGKITEELQVPKVIDSLQQSSDIELKKSLGVISNYDPEWFYGKLQELKKLLKQGQ